MKYPELNVPGVRVEDMWQLFNCSNYQYYLMKVKSLQDGVCGFCTIDRSVNKVYFETDYWVAMENSVAPRSDQSGQEHQFVIPCKRHVSSLDELRNVEFSDLIGVIKDLDKMFNISGGVIVIRSGDPAKNAKSMPHLHVNYHVPTGLKKVEVTIAKSAEDLEKKLPILRVFEKMRLIEESGHPDAAFEILDPGEQELVRDKIKAKGSC